MEPVDYYQAKGRTERRYQRFYGRERISTKIISSALRKNQLFLDVGCGSGFFLNSLIKKFPNAKFFGVDSQKQKTGFTYKQCNLEESIPYPDKKFDFLYAGEIIEHLCNPDKLLEESNRVLKQKGYLLLSTPNLCAWYNRIIFLFGIQPLFVETSTKSKLIGSGILKKLKKGETPVGHVRIFNKDAIVDILKEYGFEIVKIKGAIFDAGFPRWTWPIDRFFALFPSLSSDFVILARKVRDLQ